MAGKLRGCRAGPLWIRVPTPDAPQLLPHTCRALGQTPGLQVWTPGCTAILPSGGPPKETALLPAPTSCLLRTRQLPGSPTQPHTAGLLGLVCAPGASKGVEMGPKGSSLDPHSSSPAGTKQAAGPFALQGLPPLCENWLFQVLWFAEGPEPRGRKAQGPCSALELVLVTARCPSSCTALGRREQHLFHKAFINPNAEACRIPHSGWSLSVRPSPCHSAPRVTPTAEKARALLKRGRLSFIQKRRNTRVARKGRLMPFGSSCCNSLLAPSPARCRCAHLG